MDLGFPGEAPAQPGVGTSRIGGDLRAARERLGWDIEPVAEALKLKPAFIRAIEQGDLAGLPAPAYTVGFVRTYATALGLDPNEAIRRFRGERNEVNRKTELAFPAPVPQRGVPAGALVLVGAVIAIGGYIGWYHYSGRSLRSTATVDQVPAHLEPLAPPSGPRVVMMVPSSSKKVVPPELHAAAVGASFAGEPDVSPSSAAAAVPMPPAAPPVAAASAPAAASSGAASPAVVAATTPAPVQAAEGVANAAANTSAPGVPGPMVIQATADAWIEIKNAAGRVVYETVLHPGGSYTVPDQPQLTLTTGNASATKVILSGNTIGPLRGHVLRNVPLDADSLRAASAQPDGAAPTAQ